jgi:YhcH/YjgK/YiaL family protein
MVTNRPGHCTILFPEDAHMPKLSIGVPRIVKKVVVKIRVSAL